MANTNRKNTLDQAGEYTLDRCEIVSYKNAENNKPRTIDIKLITGSIELVENMGSEILVHVKINEFTFRSVQSRSSKLKIGDTVNLKPKKGQVHLFNKDGEVIRNE